MVSDGYDEEQAWGAEDAGAADEAEAEQLALDDGDEPLPWLESDDDYEEEGVDTARILAFAIIGLLIVGLLVGGIWWAMRDRTDPALAADGGVIAAPDGPYKTKPEDPGGKTFAGTGDASFQVAEGKSPEGQIASDPVPHPSVDIAGSDAPPVAPPAASGGVGVQVGAYSTRDGAEQGWNRLVGQFEALKGFKHRVIEGQADIGTVFRLQAVAGDMAAANALCKGLQAAGGACQVKP